jgi:hypothetical protein
VRIACSIGGLEVVADGEVTMIDGRLEAATIAAAATKPISTIPSGANSLRICGQNVLPAPG